ncbi:MAG: bifunctional diaminohydroxyphosphoribosylaminopyrimidine deaminase/5-amino-6-(5-phosphoribosylamino)uracil reductase RibD [Phycisphaerales bacterium]
MTARDLEFLRRAARISLRGHGGVEPNPMVGCVIVGADGRVVAEGAHRRHGEAHAEAIALARAGERARGATAYVTLEPCGHHGRTPPCADALVRAGIARLVYAVSDPNPIAAGGASKVASAGIRVDRVECRDADRALAPFLHRVRTGLPWVTVKWAQSIDGKIAARTGDSKWISCERSRRLVHRERGRVDAILTGYGTVRRDDPLLTARGVRRRRVAMRVVVDPSAELPADLRIFDQSAAPTFLATLPAHAAIAAARGLRHAALGRGGELRPLLLALARDHGVSTVLVEAGGGLVGQLLKESLVDELLVFVAPILLGDEDAIDAARGLTPLSIADARRFELVALRRRGIDAFLHYRRV